MSRLPLDAALLATPRTLPLSLWVIGAISAIGIHAGGIALATAYASPTELDDDSGAPAIEIGVELEAPHREQTDLPPGPESDASTASQAVREQLSKAEKTALPQAKPDETDDPDRVVSPEAATKPTEHDPKAPPVRANPANDAAAAEAAAPPSSPAAKESTRSAAPTQGSGESAQRQRVTWQRQLVAHLDRNKRYPDDASRHDAEILVTFSLDRLGHVVSASIKKGSGFANFDAAALAMMRKADPVPAPPPLVADEGLNFTLPVIFRANARK
jgi:periplasmic protein TonB